jgi:hypothetical protein
MVCILTLDVVRAKSSPRISFGYSDRLPRTSSIEDALVLLSAASNRKYVAADMLPQQAVTIIAYQEDVDRLGPILANHLGFRWREKAQGSGVLELYADKPRLQLAGTQRDTVLSSIASQIGESWKTDLAQRKKSNQKKQPPPNSELSRQEAGLQLLADVPEPIRKQLAYSGRLVSPPYNQLSKESRLAQDTL